MGVGMGSQKFVGWGEGVSLPARNRTWSFYIKRFERTYGDPPEHFTPRVPPSFKVTQVFGSDTGRSASYDFLLMICGISSVVMHSSVGRTAALLTDTSILKVQTDKTLKKNYAK